MLSTKQLQQIWLLSDTVLYPEAVSFIRRLIREEGCAPLPMSQVIGLLSIAESAKYDELYRFVVHQRDRNWPPSKSDIKKFYNALERFLMDMQRRRLKNEFDLSASRVDTMDSRQEVEELMALLAREFIQHLVAENGILAVENARERARTGRR